MTGGWKYLSFEVESVCLSLEDVFSFTCNDFPLNCAASEKCYVMLLLKIALL